MTRTSWRGQALWLVPVFLLHLGGCLFNGGEVVHTPGPEYHDTSVAGLPMEVPPDTFRAGDGDTLVLTAAPFKKILKGREVRMLGYNGSIPGPFIKVKQGSKVTLRLHNRLGMPTTLHPHGLRLANFSDGTLGVQPAIAHGDSFDYELTFPDPGPFWYHPHFGESYQIELGLYGGIVVEPLDSAYWPPVHREVYLMLDDLLLDGAVPRHRKDVQTHTMMGRFGNVFMANGDTGLVLQSRRDEVIRFYLVNASNTRVLNLSFNWKEPDGSWLFNPLRVVGADLGRMETMNTQVYQLLSPGERLVIDVPFAFDERFPGGETVYLHHSYPKSTSEWEDVYIPFATVTQRPDSVTPDILKAFYDNPVSAFAAASIDSFRNDFTRPPDKNLQLTIWMDHAALAKRAHDSIGRGIEWVDHPVMGMDNSKSDTRNTRWIIRDLPSGLENHFIDWSFNRGDRVMIRIYNDSTSMHPMPHPIHFHGQRFLVLRIDGVPNPELVWKDTFLLGRGETADILLDASNPGNWMMHCHIAEHLDAMMMLNYTVK